MKGVGIAVCSGLGKTALITRLIAILAGRALRIATVKHAHRDFDSDKLGTDSCEQGAADAAEMLVSSARGWALVNELRGVPEPHLDTLLAKLAPADLALVEGFRAAIVDKIEARLPSLRLPLLPLNDPHVVAVASDAAVANLEVARLNLDDAAAIVDFIIGLCGLAAGREGMASPFAVS